MTVSHHERPWLRGDDSSMDDPTEILIAEHRVVEQALNCLERMAERWCGPGRREELDGGAIREAITFFQIFVEGWHFHREEAYFAASAVPLEGFEVGAGDAFSFHDHERCAAHLRGIEKSVGVIVLWQSGRSGDRGRGQPRSGRSDPAAMRRAEIAAAYRGFGEHARAYSDVLLQHIEHEEDFVYPLIERHLTPDGRRAAAEAFHRASVEVFGRDRLEECLAIVGRLAERFRVANGTVR